MVNLDSEEGLSESLFGLTTVNQGHWGLDILFGVGAVVKESGQEVLVVRAGEGSLLVHRDGTVPEELVAVTYSILEQSQGLGSILKERLLGVEKDNLFLVALSRVCLGIIVGRLGCGGGNGTLVRWLLFNTVNFVHNLLLQIDNVLATSLEDHIRPMHLGRFHPNLSLF